MLSSTLCVPLHLLGCLLRAKGTMAEVSAPCPPPSTAPPWVQTGPPGCLGCPRWGIGGREVGPPGPQVMRDLSPASVFTATQPSTGFPGSSDGKASACYVEDPGLIPGLGRSPWRRKWPPTPVPLPGKIPWTEEPGGRQSMGSQSTERLHSLDPPLNLVSLVQVSQPGQRPQEGWSGAPSWRQVAGSGQRPRVSGGPSPGTQGAPLSPTALAAPDAAHLGPPPPGIQSSRLGCQGPDHPDPSV